MTRQSISDSRPATPIDSTGLGQVYAQQPGLEATTAYERIGRMIRLIQSELTSFLIDRTELPHPIFEVEGEVPSRTLGEQLALAWVGSQVEIYSLEELVTKVLPTLGPVARELLDSNILGSVAAECSIEVNGRREFRFGTPKAQSEYESSAQYYRDVLSREQGDPLPPAADHLRSLQGLIGELRGVIVALPEAERNGKYVAPFLSSLAEIERVSSGSLNGMRQLLEIVNRDSELLFNGLQQLGELVDIHAELTGTKREELQTFLHVPSTQVDAVVQALGEGGVEEIPARFGLSQQNGELRLIGTLLSIDPTLVATDNDSRRAELMRERVKPLLAVPFSAEEVSGILQAVPAVLRLDHTRFGRYVDRLIELRVRYDRFHGEFEAMSPQRAPEIWAIRDRQTQLATALNERERREFGHLRESVVTCGGIVISRALRLFTATSSDGKAVIGNPEYTVALLLSLREDGRRTAGEMDSHLLRDRVRKIFVDPTLFNGEKFDLALHELLECGVFVRNGRQIAIQDSRQWGPNGRLLLSIYSDR